jgi:hypothetical protein
MNYIALLLNCVYVQLQWMKSVSYKNAEVCVVIRVLVSRT